MERTGHRAPPIPAGEPYRQKVHGVLRAKLSPTGHVSLLSSPPGRAWGWNRPSHGKAGAGKMLLKAPRSQGSNFKK